MDSRPARSNAPLFVGLWALYFLINQLKQTPWPEELSPPLMLVRLGLVATSIMVLARLKDARWFVAMTLLQVIAVILEMPELSNCWLFTGIVNLGVLAAALRLWQRRKRNIEFNTENLYAEIAPLLRVSLLVLYALAATAKYNWGFLDPSQSAASYFANLFLRSMGISVQSAFVDWSAIIGALIIETALPIMLFFPSTRRYAIVLGMAFHTMLAHNHNLSVFDFTAMLFALYVTFAPADLLAKVRFTEESKWVIWASQYRVKLTLFLVGLSLIVIAWSTTTGLERIILWRYQIGLCFLVSISLTIVAAQLLFGADRPDQPLSSPFRLTARWDWLVVGLVLFNGLTPYLGLKTGVAYTMFSNLRTEAGYANHLWMPTSLRVFDMQDQPVRILASTDDRLAEFAKNEELLLLYDLQLRAQSLGEHSVRYEQNGTIRHVPRIADDAVLGQQIPFLAQKTLHFRTIPTAPGEPQW